MIKHFVIYTNNNTYEEPCTKFSSFFTEQKITLSNIIEKNQKLFTSMFIISLKDSNYFENVIIYGNWSYKNMVKM